jgi:hypothetical protein
LVAVTSFIPYWDAVTTILFLYEEGRNMGGGVKEREGGRRKRGNRFGGGERGEVYLEWNVPRLLPFFSFHSINNLPPQIIVPLLLDSDTIENSKQQSLTYV